MQDNVSTGPPEFPALDCETWKIAFEPYANDADDALILAYHLTALSAYLQSDTQNIPEAIAAIDRAINMLYRHTDFHKVSRELYRVVITGKLDAKLEKVLNSLGLRT